MDFRVTISVSNRAVASVVSQLRLGVKSLIACVSRPYGPSPHGFLFTLIFVKPSEEK